MPQRPVDRDVPLVPGPRRPLFSSAALALLIGPLAAMLALPATLQAAPAMAAPRCEVPALPKAAPATPSPRAAATPVAKGTPVAATPVAAAADALGALPLELDAAARSLAACLSEGDGAGVADLVTEPWMSAWFGGAQVSREQFLELAPDLTLPSMEIRSLSDVRRTGAKGAAADVEYVIGRQLAHATWTFVEAPPDQRTPGKTAWRIDGEEPLPVKAPARVTGIEAEMGDGSLTLSRQDLKPGDLRISAANGGAQDHELTVLKFASGYTLPDLLRAAGPGLPGETEWIGQLTVPAGGKGDLVLVGLEPGSYWVICLLPNADGTPHAALGEAAAFTVK